MGCVCCSLSSFISVALDALERISLCTVCAMLTCCLLFTIMTMLVIGMGIGYHYCFVQTSVDAMAKAAKAAGALRSGPSAGGSGHVLRSVEKAMNRGFAHRMSRRDADSPPANNLTISSNLTDSVTNDTVFNDLPTVELTTFNATNFTIS
ncbi:hypothetical protein B5X24_HaOG212716 [Helicoverpa armigera]|nr:uncharacterized protein LOC110372849 isoform X1 [Helicoverpa armigera]PZC81511.1 hypothetical protein B5X24_HaOG212716 [Helicoverpa armigera]